MYWYECITKMYYIFIIFLLLDFCHWCLSYGALNSCASLICDVTLYIVSHLAHNLSCTSAISPFIPCTFIDRIYHPWSKYMHCFFWIEHASLLRYHWAGSNTGQLISPHSIVSPGCQVAADCCLGQAFHTCCKDHLTDVKLMNTTFDHNIFLWSIKYSSEASDTKLVVYMNVYLIN